MAACCTECPDLFELAVDNDPDNKKAVFWGANGSYIIRNFDGNTFAAESKVMHSNFGNCSYAAQTWSNIPEGSRSMEVNRCIQIAWCKQDLPGMPFNQWKLSCKTLQHENRCDGQMNHIFSKSCSNE